MEINCQFRQYSFVFFRFQNITDQNTIFKYRMENHRIYRRNFAVLLLTIQVLMVVLYGIFVRINVHADQSNNKNYYPMYQDVNVMMLIGFGFLMTFLRSHSWSALAYTFFINAVVLQMYTLFGGFWLKALENSWGQTIYIDQKAMTTGLYAVAAVLISFGAVLGRVGAFQLLLMAIFQTIGYTLNEKIVYDSLKIYDVGGSTAIHTYGAYFGLTVSLMLHKVATPKEKKAESSYTSNIFAFVGTLFLWMFWPSFNVGVFPQTPLEKSTIIVNTVISLTGSCIATFIVSALMRRKFSAQDILNATLAGGVAIGAPSGIIVNTTFSLIIGVLAGTISTICYNKLSPKLEEYFDIYDTCGVHNLHGIPGLLGGISSAIIIAGYGGNPIVNQITASELHFYSHIHNQRTFNEQGVYQIAGTFTSIAMGILFGMVTGVVIRCFYSYENQQNLFYEDSVYFEIPGIQSIVVNDFEQHGQAIHLKDSFVQSDTLNNFSGLPEFKINHKKQKKIILPPIVNPPSLSDNVFKKSYQNADAF